MTDPLSKLRSDMLRPKTLTIPQAEELLLRFATFVDYFGEVARPWLDRAEREYVSLLKPKEVDRIKKFIADQKQISVPPLTISRAAERYWNEIGVRHANSETTDTDLARLVEYFGEAKLLADIDDAEVAKLVQWRSAQPAWGREERKDGKPMPLVTPSTVNRSTTLVLKKLFTRAKRTWRYTFPHEPIWADHFLKEPKERVRELKKDESSALSLATRSDYEPIFSFVRATGLRLNECILKWSEVDWETGWISKPGKGGRMVKTAITSTVRDILLPLRGNHPEYVFTYQAKRTRNKGAGYKGDGVGRKAGDHYPITYSGLKTQWKRIRAKAGVQDFRFHDFRHDLATKLLRDTGNLKTVQKALSHADIKTTTRYAHVLDEEVAQAMEMLSRKRITRTDSSSSPCPPTSSDVEKLRPTKECPDRDPGPGKESASPGEANPLMRRAPSSHKFEVST